jgi:hypothetical protein
MKLSHFQISFAHARREGRCVAPYTLRRFRFRHVTLGPCRPLRRHPGHMGAVFHMLAACRTFVRSVARSFSVSTYGWPLYTGRSPPNVSNTFTSSASRMNVISLPCTSGFIRPFITQALALIKPQITSTLAFLLESYALLYSFLRMGATTFMKMIES